MQVNPIHKTLRDKEAEINRTWGIERLFSLIPNNMKIKFERADYLYKQAINKGSRKQINGMVSMMLRAYDALVQTAKDLGYKELEPDIRCYKYKNQYILIIEKDIERKLVYEKYQKEKDCIIFSIEELLRVLPPDLLRIKKTFTNERFNCEIETIKYANKT